MELLYKKGTLLECTISYHPSLLKGEVCTVDSDVPLTNDHLFIRGLKPQSIRNFIYICDVKLHRLRRKNLYTTFLTQ
jgi:hypothetical protein